jgi:hypothetical protein
METSEPRRDERLRSSLPQLADTASHAGRIGHHPRMSDIEIVGAWGFQPQKGH